MSQQIRDGAGTGYMAKVNANQRMYTSAVTIEENLQATTIVTGKPPNL